MKKIKKEEDQMNKNKLRIKMMDITEKMEDLLNEEMTDDRFWGM